LPYRLKPASSLVRRFRHFNYAHASEIYALSLHDALPIYAGTAAKVATSLLLTSNSRLAITRVNASAPRSPTPIPIPAGPSPAARDRKSTRLNSSHDQISYAVFCLKKKKRLQSGKTHPPTT